jgi:4-hydroxyphenylpyruvate dioxygenase
MSDTRSSDDTRPAINGIDHIALYVGNAHQAAHYYRAAFGFEPVAYCGLETGARDRISWALAQGSATLVVSSGLDPDGPIARHVHEHGDTIKDIAFKVDDAAGLFEHAVRRGAFPVCEPTTIEDERGQLTYATVAAAGDVWHSFVERTRYAGVFWPGYQARPARVPPSPIGLRQFDHFAIGVGAGQLADYVDFYRRVFGFVESHEENVMTGRTGMRSKVVRGPADGVVFPILEPAPAVKRSQIEDYLHFHRGPGVQHAALLTDDIVHAVRSLVENGVEFLPTPEVYYESLLDRVGPLPDDLLALRQLGIMVDRDETGYLFQLFTKAVTGRPTLFFEVIERRGSRGFGGGNIRALFEAVERAQLAPADGAGVVAT